MLDLIADNNYEHGISIFKKTNDTTDVFTLNNCTRDDTEVENIFTNKSIIITDKFPFNYLLENYIINSKNVGLEMSMILKYDINFGLLLSDIGNAIRINSIAKEMHFATFLILTSENIAESMANFKDHKDEFKDIEIIYFDADGTYISEAVASLIPEFNKISVVSPNVSSLNYNEIYENLDLRDGALNIPATTFKFVNEYNIKGYN